jgi:hypothetical protein
MHIGAGNMAFVIGKTGPADDFESKTVEKWRGMEQKWRGMEQKWRGGGAKKKKKKTTPRKKKVLKKGRGTEIESRNKFLRCKVSKKWVRRLILS